MCQQTASVCCFTKSEFWSFTICDSLQSENFILWKQPLAHFLYVRRTAKYVMESNLSGSWSVREIVSDENHDILCIIITTIKVVSINMLQALVAEVSEKSVVELNLLCMWKINTLGNRCLQLLKYNLSKMFSLQRSWRVSFINTTICY